MKTQIKRTIVCLLVAITFIMTFQCLICSATNDREEFTIGFDAEFPPYGYKSESGEYVGFDIDLAQEVCNRKGWTLKKQPIEWNSKDMELSSGSIDCIWNGFLH